LVDLYFEQANVFSAIVGIFGVTKSREEAERRGRLRYENVTLKRGKPIMTEVEHFKSAPPNKL
jgi:hypothetical protein